MAARVQSHAARDTRVTYIHVAHKLTYSHPYALTNSLTYSASLTYLRTYELTNLLGVRAAVDEFAALHDLELEVHGIVWFVTKPEVDAPESRAAGSARHADARGCAATARGLATARMAALTLVCSFVLAGLWRRS